MIGERGSPAVEQWEASGSVVQSRSSSGVIAGNEDGIELAEGWIPKLVQLARALEQANFSEAEQAVAQLPQAVRQVRAPTIEAWRERVA